MSGWAAYWRRHAIRGLLLASSTGVDACLRRFRRLESASADAIGEYQRRQLLELLRHCRAHVPYYRRLIEQYGLDLSDSFDTAELSKLPLLTKDIIRQQGGQLYSDDRGSRHPYRNSSGGSTGSPIVFVQDRAYHAGNVVAAKIIYNEILGKRMGELEFNLWGSERDISRGSLGARQRAINYLYNRRFQNFFKVDDETLAAYCSEINRRRPVSIWAYSGSLELLAKFIRRSGRDIHSPRLVISTAGTLFPALRELAQDVFRCPVYNQYGSRELGAIAFEIQDQDGLRGFPYLNYVEVVDGNVIVTCLTNYSMPFVRYDIGDTATPWTGLQNDRLGCRHKVFKELTGRVHSHFRTADGGLVYGGFFAQQFYYLDWVREFQVVQERTDLVCCYLVASAKPVEADMQRIRQRMQKVMGGGCEIEFVLADGIEPSPSGKHMYTLSKV